MFNISESSASLKSPSSLFGEDAIRIITSNETWLLFLQNRLKPKPIHLSQMT